MSLIQATATFGIGFEDSQRAEEIMKNVINDDFGTYQYTVRRRKTPTTDVGCEVHFAFTANVTEDDTDVANDILDEVHVAASNASSHYEDIQLVTITGDM